MNRKEICIIALLLFTCFVGANIARAGEPATKAQKQAAVRQPWMGPTAEEQQSRLKVVTQRLNDVGVAATLLTSTMASITKGIEETKITTFPDGTGDANREILEILGGVRSATFGVLSLRSDVNKRFEGISETVERNGLQVGIEDSVKERAFIAAYTSAAASITEMNFKAAKLATKYREMAEKFGKVEHPTGMSPVTQAVIRP